MQYCIFAKGGEIPDLMKLKNLHDKFKDSDDDFFNVFQDFIDTNRQNTSLVGQPYIENFVSNLGQIIYSFSEFKKAKEHFPDEKNKEDNYYYSVETASMLVFFFNAKAFLEIINRYVKLPKEKFQQILNDITIIRDHLAHAYDKETKRNIFIQTYPKVFVTNTIQRGFEIESIELIELKSGIRLGTLYFSLHVFFFLLKEIFEEIKSKNKLSTNSIFILRK